jgi:hypothetical protein
MRIITPAMILIAFVAGCIDEAPRPKPQPTDGSGKADEDDGELVPVPGDEEPPDDGTCGEAQKPGDNQCLP